MARIDKNGKIRGRIGNLIHRVIGDTNIIQSVSGKRKAKLTTGSVRSSISFGLASNRARIIREALHPLIRRYYDGKMINRFKTAVEQAIKEAPDAEILNPDITDANLPALSGFEFNLNSPFSFICKVGMELDILDDGSVWLRLDAFNPVKDIKGPDDYHHAKLGVLLLALDFENSRHQYCGLGELEFSAGSKAVPATEWVFKEGIPSGCILMAVGCLEFFGKTVMGAYSMNGKDMHPVSLLAAFHSPVLPGAEQRITEPDPADFLYIWESMVNNMGEEMQKRHERNEEKARKKKRFSL